ncbi:MAG: DUF2283 domain-containing protein [Chloroflexi bacterium]|nr:DUF2283 domain-containing protein [Chloroflexota bacterium]
MYIRLNHKLVHRNQVAADNAVVLDIAEDGTLVGIELISPSRYTADVSKITYRYLPKESAVSTG